MNTYFVVDFFLNSMGRNLKKYKYLLINILQEYLLSKI